MTRRRATRDSVPGVAIKRNAWEQTGRLVSGGGAVLALVASFFLTGEERYPGLFYVQRQAFWNDGRYGVKLTFLLTWFTLCGLVIVPVLFVAGAVALLKRLTASLPSAPFDWDVQLVGHRVKRGLGAFLLLPTWLVITGIVVFAPEWFSPLGGFASILLLLLPTLPILGPALFFEAVIPPSYVEGIVESMQVVTYQNRTTVHLFVAGRAYQAHPHVAANVREGSRIGLLATGFFKSVWRIVTLG
jgi:hypothetical protein